MDKRDLFKIGGLGLLAGLALLVARYDLLKYLLDPFERRQAWMNHGDEFLSVIPRVLTGVCAGGVALVVLVLGVIWMRKRAQRLFQEEIAGRVALGPTVLLFPRADWKRVDPEDVQVWVRLADALPHDEHISFEIGGSQDGVAFGLHGSAEGVRAALTQFRAEWPGLFRKMVKAEEDPAILPEGWEMWWVELAPASYERAVEAISVDPLRAILIELNGVLGKGRGLVQVIARRNYGVRKALGEKAFAARDVEVESKGVRALRMQEAKELEARARATYLDVTVRAVGLADTAERAQGIARGLARAIAASFDGINPVQPVGQGSEVQRVTWRKPGYMAPWSANDLAFLAHLAGNDLLSIAPRLATAPARYLPADPEMRFDVSRYRTAFLLEE